MMMNGRRTRSVALLAGGVLAVSSLLQGAFFAAPAQAADKSKKYKTGAIVLGAASAYLIIKGKTLPGVIAGAGAYYAYKKSKKAKQEEQYSQYPDDDFYNEDEDVYQDGDDSSEYPDDLGYEDGQYPDYGYQGIAPGVTSRATTKARSKSHTKNSKVDWRTLLKK